MVDGNRIIEDLKEAHRVFSASNSKAAKGMDDDDRLELRAEATGHNVMLHDAIRIIKQHFHL